MSDSSGIRGVVVSVPTPFLEDGEIDTKILQELLDFYLGAGAHALFVNGSYGQGPAMTLEQRQRTAEIITKRVGKKVPVIIHVGTVDPYTSSELGRHARSIGADAISIVGPYYYSDHSEDEIINHYRMVDQATELPVLVYNNPEYSGYNITPRLMAKLVDAVPRIFGAKVNTARSISQAKRYLAQVSDKNFAVFTAAGIMFPGLVAGIRGTISPRLSVAPEIGLKLVRAVDEGKLDQALAHQLKIIDYQVMTDDLFSTFGENTNCEALRLRGFKIQRITRWPPKPLTEQARSELRKGLELLGIAVA